MKIIYFIFFLQFILFTQSIDDSHFASKAKADQIERTRCGYNLMKLWTAEVAHSPFAAAPLITDVDGDGKLDIVAAPLSESQTVVEAETGKTLTGSRWPTQKLDTSILASPLQYDIDGDGMLDILFVTFSADILFYTPNGTAIKNKFLELNSLLLRGVMTYFIAAIETVLVHVLRACKVFDVLKTSGEGMYEMADLNTSIEVEGEIKYISLSQRRH